jgi:hypothetical protein
MPHNLVRIVQPDREIANQPGSSPALVSMAIFAWNEESGISSTLESLFQQSIFSRLAAQKIHCEVYCVLNGCEDGTARVASEFFAKWRKTSLFADFVHCGVADIKEKGKLNAWNQYVHEISSRQARSLFMMDADILIHLPNTLWNMFQTLEQDKQANVSIDRPCKDIIFKQKKNLRERVSVAMSGVTAAAPAQLCGQLYCIRAETARKIYLPKDLSACEDGFIKALVCTDSLTQPIQPARIRLAPEAEHTFEAYTAPGAILKNQKRQIMGQTIVHLLIDGELKGLPQAERENLAVHLKNREIADPQWLKKLIAAHMKRTKYFWKLYPGLLGQRFKAFGNMSAGQRFLSFPAALAGAVAATPASFLAWRALKSGSTNYWPRAQRLGLKPIEVNSAKDLSTNKSTA